MEISEAVSLLEKGVPKDEKQTWADLGAGSGLFSRALKNLLAEGSVVIAIDKKSSKIEGVRSQSGNFLDLDFANTDGIVMANSLHYVKDQKGFLQQLSKKTKRLIIVEYNTDKGNLWVPYPISFNQLKLIFPDAKQIGEHASQYHKEGIYSALILF